MVGTPYHYLAEMNLFNLFALSGCVEQKCSFSARAYACASVLLALALLVLHVILHHWKEEIKSFQTKKSLLKSDHYKESYKQKCHFSARAHASVALALLVLHVIPPLERGDQELSNNFFLSKSDQY